MHASVSPVSLAAVAHQPQCTVSRLPFPTLSAELAEVQRDTLALLSMLVVLSTEPQGFIDDDDVDFVESRANVILNTSQKSDNQIVVAIRLYCEIVGRLEAIAEHHNCLLLKELPWSLRFLREHTSCATVSP
jgi:hypothetical protein